MSETIDVYKKEERPAYRILATSGFFGPDDTLYEEGAEIYYDGEPNEEMEPLNESAKTKLIAYLEKLEILAKEVATKLNRPYVGRPRNLDGQLALASAVQKSEMSVLGKHAEENTNIQKIVTDEAPVTGLGIQKRGRGRPKGAVKNGVSLAKVV